MPAEPVISCCVREESAKASKQSPPFVEVRMLCDICQDGSVQIPTESVPTQSFWLFQLRRAFKEKMKPGDE